MQVIFTPLAERQIEELYNYIVEHGGEPRAASYVERIIAACKRLEMFPERGTRHDDVLRGLWSIGFEHRVTIAFVVSADAVLIEGIFYGGQDFEAVFREKTSEP